MSDKPFDYWAFFVDEAKRADSPLYMRYAEGVGASGEMRAFAARAKKGQPPANMLFASVHYLLLRGADHPLRRFYPHLGGAAQAAHEDPVPDFMDFVAQHRDALAPLIATKVTNTNEVGRCAALHPAFRAVAAQAGEPLNLIEIGPSAGFNLNWDRYGVRYRRGDETFDLPVPDATLILNCELRGGKRPPLGPNPNVASRVGLELNPVDLTDADQRDWLRALVWPGTHGRFERLEAALKIYEQNKPPIRVGDALALLPNALRDVPEDKPVCVYHSFVIYQFSREMKEAFDAILVMAGLRRPVWRIGYEGAPDGTNTLTLTRYQDGVRAERILAYAHPHGAWLEWRDEPARAVDGAGLHGIV